MLREGLIKKEESNEGIRERISSSLLWNGPIRNSKSDQAINGFGHSHSEWNRNLNPIPVKQTQQLLESMNPIPISQSKVGKPTIPWNKQTSNFVFVIPEIFFM